MPSAIGLVSLWVPATVSGSTSSSDEFSLLKLTLTECPFATSATAFAGSHERIERTVTRYLTASLR